MLSPGKYHLSVPKGWRSNRHYRADTLRRAVEDSSFRFGLLAACKTDIVFWIDTFVYQYNPKEKSGGAVAPFIAWDFQEQFLLDRPETTGRKGVLWCYERDRTAVVQKSREMGASWLFLIVQGWLGLFHHHVQCLNISRSADAVDCKSPNSLFWKLRFIHRYLPSWMTGNIVQEKMYIEYPRTESVITGEASTGKAGVGGRGAVVFVDEFPLITQGKAVRAHTANTADCRFFNGTHTGVGSEFYEMTRSPDLVQMAMHWTQHPRKNKGLYRWNLVERRVEYLRYDGVKREIVADPEGKGHDPSYEFVTDGRPTGGPHPGVRSPWYDRKVKDIGSPRAVAMDLDMDAPGAASQVFDPLMIRELQARHGREPDWRGELRFDPDSGLSEGFVPLPTGKLKLWRGLDSWDRMRPSRYVLGADVSTGSGATPSCIAGFDGRTGEKVLEYIDPHIKNERFGSLMAALGRVLVDENGMPAYVGVECPGPGNNVIGQLVKVGYRHLYCRTDDNPLGEKVSERAGWFTTPEGKQVMLEDYQAALRSGACTNYSAESLERTLGFEYKTGGLGVWHPNEKSADASGGGINHGDVVIADALAWKLTKGMAGGPIDVPPEEAPVGSLAWRRDQWRGSRRREKEWTR